MSEHFIYEDGHKRPATLEEVQRVRELECDRHGHDYKAVLVFQGSDPHHFVCRRCSKTWRVVADDGVGS